MNKNFIKKELLNYTLLTLGSSVLSFGFVVFLFQMN